MAKITMKFDAETARAVQGFLKIEDRQKAIERNAQNLARSSKKGAQEAAQGNRAWLRSLQGIASAFVGIGSAAAGAYATMRQMRKEYDNLVTRQATAGMTQIGLQKARTGAIANLPQGMSPAELDAITKRASAASGATQGPLYQLAGPALSAKGSLSPEQFERGLILGGKLIARGQDPATVATTVAGAFDIMKPTGATPGQAFGFARQVGVAARIVDPVKQIRGTGAMVGAAAGIGATPEEMAEMFAHFTQVGVDPTGERSITGTIQFMGGVMRKDLSPSHRRGTTFPERLAGLQADWATMSPANRDALIKKMGGEQRMQPLYRQLLARDPATMATLAEVQKQIGDPADPALAGLTETYMEQTTAGPLGLLQRKRQAYLRGTEAMYLANPQAMAGVAREGMRKMLKATPGVTNLQQSLEAVSFEGRSNFGRGDVVGAEIAILEDVRRQKQFGSKRRRSRLGEFIGDVEDPSAFGDMTEPNPLYNPQAGAGIDDMLYELRAIRKALETPMRVDVSNSQANRMGGANGVE